MELTSQQQQALDNRGNCPARVILSETQQIQVLLPSADYAWIRGLIPDLPEVLSAVDPRTSMVYAVLPQAVYERFKGFFEEDPLSTQEQRALVRDFGKRVGWDDPAMDVYDESRKHA